VQGNAAWVEVLNDSPLMNKSRPSESAKPSVP